MGGTKDSRLVQGASLIHTTYIQIQIQSNTIITCIQIHNYNYNDTIRSTNAKYIIKGAKNVTYNEKGVYMQNLKC